ncbi:MAG: hypothetical protein AB2A00_22870 [Myxococcota bacterium]
MAVASISGSGHLVERVGQNLTVRAQLWPRGEPPLPGVVEVAENAPRAAPVASLLVEANGKEGPRFKALVHGYGCSCAEEVELWEKPGLILVGVGQAATVLDANTGVVKLRVPMGGYFNSLWLAEDGRDAFLCGDEQVVRLVPPGIISWQKTLGVDGVLVHRAVGMTVFVSAQRKVGGPWVDFLLDRATGAVQEAPDPDDDGDAADTPARADAKSGTADPKKRPAAAPAVKRKPEPPVQADDPDTVDDDDPSVRLVRDDETDPDDE